MSAYPEHDKLIRIKDQSQAIGEFMDWLADDGIFLAKKAEDEPEHPFDFSMAYPVQRPIQDLLATFFGIDQNKLEAEKRQMLESR